MAKKPKEENVRSTTFDVVPPEDKRNAVLNAIRTYRALCRETYAICALGNIAGSSIIFDDKGNIQVKPDKKNARELLAKVFDKDGPQELYQLRDYHKHVAMPKWYSFVTDQLRIDVHKVWKSKDPEFTNASKGWLLLNGARSVARFNNIGMGFPSVMGPKLDKHTVTLKWDHDLGPVEFQLPRLDSGRYYIYKALRDGLPGWELRTTYLTERDGKIFLVISYKRPENKADLDSGNVLEVTFTEQTDKFITMKGPGNLDGDCISSVEAMGLIRQIKIKSDKWKASKEAVGSPKKPWGSARMWHSTQERISALSSHRENAVKDRNHLWTRRIVEDAKRWRCGTVKLVNVPERELFGEPWNWSQFKNFLDYKVKEIGGVIA